MWCPGGNQRGPGTGDWTLDFCFRIFPPVFESRSWVLCGAAGRHGAAVGCVGAPTVPAAELLLSPGETESPAASRTCAARGFRISSICT